MPRRIAQMRWKTKPGRKPYAEVRIAGKCYHLGTSRTGAARRYALLIRKHYRELAGAEEPPDTVAELVFRWTVQHPDDTRPWAPRAWADYAGSICLDEIESDHLDGFVSWLKRGYHISPVKHARGATPERSAASYAPSSIKERVGYALRICAWAVDRGWLPRAPRRPRMPASVRRPKDLSPAQLAEVFASLPARTSRLLRFCLETGARPAEARLLRWEHLDLDRSIAILPAHKTAHRTGSVRTVYINTAARSVLDKCKLPSGRGTGWVFPSKSGEPYTSSGLRKNLRRHAPGVTPYQMRHSFAQHAADSGIDISDLAGLLGHSDVRTTKFYAEIGSARLARAVEALASPLPQRPSSDPALASENTDPSGRATHRSRRGKSATGRRRTA